MAKEIGLGPSLFLMSTKALSTFFFFLFLINIPTMIIFHSQEHPGHIRNFTEWKINKIERFFYEVSFGNMGYDLAK